MPYGQAARSSHSQADRQTGQRKGAAPEGGERTTRMHDASRQTENRCARMTMRARLDYNTNYIGYGITSLSPHLFGIANAIRPNTPSLPRASQKVSISRAAHIGSGAETGTETGAGRI